MLGGAISTNYSNDLTEDERKHVWQIVKMAGDEITALASALGLPAAKTNGTTPSNVVAVLDPNNLHLVFERASSAIPTFVIRKVPEVVQSGDVGAFAAQEYGLSKPSGFVLPRRLVEAAEEVKRAEIKQLAGNLMAQAKQAFGKPRALPGFEALQPLLDAFSNDHPQFDKNVFVAMRFADTPQNKEIWTAIDDSLRRYGMKAQRADAKSYPQDDDLWNNVCVYMMGCKFGICVFDQIDQRDFNPNVQIEYGFMRASDKRVLLLKDLRQPSMPVDITGKIRREFDTYNITATVSARVAEWLERDLGLKPVP